MTELKQLRDFAEQINGIRPQERSLKGVVNNLISNYKGGTTVIANPTLEGDEDNLTGLQVGDTKYAVPQGATSNIYVYNKKFIGLNGEQILYKSLSTELLFENPFSTLMPEQFITQEDLKVAFDNIGNITGNISSPDTTEYSISIETIDTSNHNVLIKLVSTDETIVNISFTYDELNNLYAMNKIVGNMILTCDVV